MGACVGFSSTKLNRNRQGSLFVEQDLDSESGERRSAEELPAAAAMNTGNLFGWHPAAH